MAAVTRYFSTASAGTRDGTSWANRAQLFASGINVNSGTWSGPFTAGETVTQTGTGATATVELAGGSGTLFFVSNLSGSPNGTGVWTGSTSGATVTPTATPTTNNWSPLIRGHDYATNPLLCYIGAGSYTCNQALAFTVSPTTANRLVLHGANASGNAWAPPDRDWSSSQAEWSSVDMPVITTSTNALALTGNIFFYGLSITGATAGVLCGTTSHMAEWCIMQNTANNPGATAYGGRGASNCVFKCSGTSYAVVCSDAAFPIVNCRIVGNTSASSGTRRGVSSTTSFFLSKSTVVNCIVGFAYTAGSTRGSIDSCTFANCTTGIQLSATTLNDSQSSRIANVFVACSTAIETTSATPTTVLSDSRLRGTITQVSDDHLILINNDTASGNDSDEFVDSTNGDYRIKGSSSYWGKGYGAGDELVSGSGGGLPFIGPGGLVY